MPPKRQPKITLYYPTEIQRIRQRMVARYYQGTEQTDVPSDMITEIQSYLTYEPITLQRFNEIFFQSHLIVNDNPQLYTDYVNHFNNTNIRILRTQAQRETHAGLFIDNYIFNL